MSRKGRSRRCSAARSAITHQGRLPSPSSSMPFASPLAWIRRSSRRCYRARFPTRSRCPEARSMYSTGCWPRRKTPMTSQASRWHAQPDLQWWHVVSDRVVVRRHHRIRRVDLCFALARDRVLFARGGAKRRYICNRCDAQAWPLAKADGRIDVSRDREGRRQELVHPGEPSADRGPPGAHEPRGSAAEWPAAADGGRMDVAQGNLQFKELI